MYSTENSATLTNQAKLNTGEEPLIIGLWSDNCLVWASLRLYKSFPILRRLAVNAMEDSYGSVWFRTDITSV